MTDDKNKDDKDRKKLSDEELEDVAGGSDAAFKKAGGWKAMQNPTGTKSKKDDGNQNASDSGNYPLQG